MVRNGKTGGTHNLPQPAMTLEEAVRFYGWGHLAPGTQQRLRDTLRRFESAPSRLIVERRLSALGLVAMCVASLGALPVLGVARLRTACSFPPIGG